MSTTSAYGWNIPDNTDLVKDGALAIRTLGNAIDTSMNTALGTKKAGMVLLNTTSFSGVASQSVNDVFSATYDNYLIQTRLKGSTNLNIGFRFRVGGADNTSSTYGFGRIGLDFAGGANNTNNQGQTSFTNLCSTSTNFFGSLNLTVFNPFLSEYTTMNGTGQGLRTDYGNVAGYAIGAIFDATTSFTGFTLIASTGNITGQVSVYGVNK